MPGLTRFQAAAWAELDRRLDPASRAPIAVGFSGGGDSLAALLLVRDWAERAGRPVLALTVDHGLNVDSAAWTAQAGAQAEALGCPWRALRWDGDKPAAGLPAAARRARHALLADAAREAGAAVVVLGHTADDMAEGEAMRAHDAPTLGRLRPWSPSPAWPQGRGVFLLRPLLGAGRAELRAWLTAQGLSWLEDPANTDPRYARARARDYLSPAHSRACGNPDLLSSQKAAEMKQAWVPACAGMSGNEEQAGAVSLQRSGAVGAVVSAALLCAAGTARPPRSADLTRLLARLSAQEGFTATLCGARIEAGERTLITREPGRSPPAPLRLQSGAPAVWDGRFEILAEAAGLTVATLAGHAARLPATDRDRLRACPPAARPTLPALLQPDGSVSLPAPFGSGPATARALAPARLAAALGRVACERDIAVSDAQPQGPHGAAGVVTLC